jgi:patatin-like phospholipase/acyl hydrolase
MTAEQARDVVAKNRKVFSGRAGRGGLFSSRPEAVFKKVFGDLTVRDAAKPLLIPCYDMATAAPFVFSRADAVEAEAFDFPLWQVCAAACGVAPAEVASLDGRTRLRAAGGGGAGMANPTSVAVTHVLHNKQEFPFAAGASDLIVLSLGGNAASDHRTSSSSSILRIASACQADMVRPPLILQHSWHGQNRTVVTYAGLNRTVGARAAFQVDQAVSMAFGENRATNYIRIQVNIHCSNFLPYLLNTGLLHH